MLIGNNPRWCRLHIVPTFGGESYGLSIFFRIQWQRLHFSYAFVKGQWNAIFPSFWWTVVFSRSQLAVRTAVSVLRIAKNSFFLHTKYVNHSSIRSCNFRTTTATRHSLWQRFGFNNKRNLTQPSRKWHGSNLTSASISFICRQEGETKHFTIKDCLPLFGQPLIDT